MSTCGGLTNHSNKFHGTFHSKWYNIRGSCCTMLKSPPLCVKLVYINNDVASEHVISTDDLVMSSASSLQ